VIGKMHGLDQAELAAAKRAASMHPKTAGILKLAVAINQARGLVRDAVLAEARAAGITDAEIVEVVGHVALNVFTNYLNNVSETAIDFPVVALDTAA
jgi:alkylhydroperoxidase family enzyme